MLVEMLHEPIDAICSSLELLRQELHRYRHDLEYADVFMLRVITFHDTRCLENLRQKQYRSAIFPFDAHVYRVGDGYGVLLVVGVYFAVDQRREFRKSHPVVDSLTSTSGETSIMYSLRRFAFLPHQMSRSGIR